MAGEAVGYRMIDISAVTRAGLYHPRRPCPATASLRILHHGVEQCGALEVVVDPVLGPYELARNVSETSSKA